MYLLPALIIFSRGDWNEVTAVEKNMRIVFKYSVLRFHFMSPFPLKTNVRLGSKKKEATSCEECKLTPNLPKRSMKRRYLDPKMRANILSCSLLYFVHRYESSFWDVKYYYAAFYFIQFSRLIFF